ncbi:glycosyltransferase family 39 protein [Candidatus Microgenomates bacterium]|nr:glycosyltransferase family 39 protein [Candidatus Microgenomates bacterium]
MANVSKKSPLIASIVIIIFLFLSLYNLFNFALLNKGLFTEPFNPEIHRKLYGQSQYILKEPLSEIADEVVYALAGWEYVHGLNPILLNGEQPPLGKYIVGLSEVLFNNSRVGSLIFNVLLLVIFFLLADLVIDSKVISSVLTYLFSAEKVFIAQVRYSPNLDNIQVFFLLLTFYFFIKYLKTTKLYFSALTFISLGLVIATKFWITGFIVFLVFFVVSLLERNLDNIKKFILFSPLLILPLAVSYLNSFGDGMTIREFFGTQKYIYSWHSAKLVFDPISLVDFLFLNRWHFMGQVQKAVDWQFTWPILGTFSLISIISFFRSLKEKLVIGQPICVIVVWLIMYFVVLILSTVNARYLFPVLPAMYISSGWFIKEVFSGSQLMMKSESGKM